MMQSCRRPGCGRAASVVITYDPVGCQVWLDPMEGARGGQPLCTLHAERLHAPRGWVVLDRRAPQAVIRTGVAEPEPEAPRPSSPRRRWGQFAEPRLEFEEPAEPAEEPTTEAVEPETDPAAEAVPAAVEPEPEPAEPAALEPEPVVEPQPVVADDLERFYEPQGGLLGRAFRNAGEQRSVLTGTLPPDEH